MHALVALLILAGGPWTQLEPGLEIAELTMQAKSDVGDSTLRVLRIDPEYFEVALGNASKSGESRTARQWCKKEGFVAAINASMFQLDGVKSVALMQTRDHVNNPHLTKDKAVFAFDPVTNDVPPVQIIDRECQDLPALRKKYRGLVQNIRMISCRGKNVWSQQPRTWSTAAVGMDTRGRLLFLHTRSPYSTHDFIEELKKLPIDLKNAMYVEGGPEAQIYVESGPVEHEWIGSYETGFRENDTNKEAWPVPNVIGIRRRPKKTKP